MMPITSPETEAAAFLERLPARFGALDAGVWTWDAAGGRAAFSAEWARMFGYGDRGIEVTDRTWESMIHPLDHERVVRRWKAFLESPELSGVFEYRLRTKAGLYRWVLSRATKQFDERGRLARVAGTHLDLSEFKAAEETLLFTRFTVDRSSFGVLCWDDEGRLIYANDAACALLARSRDEVAGLRADVLGLGEDAWAELRAEKSLVLECELRRKDGPNAALEIHATWMEYGGREYVCTMAIDIRERREAERALRRQQRLFRDLTENIREVFYVAETRERRMLYVSPAYEEIWGRSREELYRDIHAYLKPVHPEDLSRVRAAFRSESADQGYDIEYRLVRPDGAIRWVRDRAFSVKGPGEAPRTVGVAKDITERKVAEEALRASERRFRRLLEGSPDTVLLHDGKKIVYVNPAGVRLLGASSADEIVGRSPLDFVHPDFRGLVEERIRRALAGAERNPNVELKMLRRDGTEVEVESIGVPLSEGDSGNIQVLLRDITERKRLQRQFLEAQKMEAVGRLAGGVAHDFNNLLTVISGYGTVAAEQLRPEDPLRAVVDEILRAAERAAGLTRQLLAFSRHQVMRAKVVDLNALVGGMDGMLRRLIGEDLRLDTRLAAGLGAVHADPGQIEQVVMNLVVNARDAMPAGGTVTIETANVDAAPAGTDLPPGPYVRLSVADTGTGMTKEVLARLFEPFFTTKEKGKGTGLGLPTSYGIVRQSGGRIAVETEPGRGSRFIVYLPRVEGASASADESKPTSVSRLGGHETILLVEDDGVVRALSSRILKGHGYRVLEAKDADEALRIADGGAPISLLLSDVIMPGMPGTRLADLLRKGNPGLGVLLVSGYTEDALLQSGGLPEGMRLLTKPFLPRALLEKVREVLDAPA